MLKPPVAEREHVEVLKPTDELTNEIKKLEPTKPDDIIPANSGLTVEEATTIIERHLRQKERNREYKRLWSQRKRQELKDRLAMLEDNQVQGATVRMVMFNDRIIDYTIQDEDDYIKLLDEVLGTLHDNKIVVEYSVRKRSLFKE